MAVETGLTKQAYGVTFTVRTASSADHATVANSTRFYDIADDIIYFKDSGGVIVSLFESGDNLYTADGTLTAARTVTMAGFGLSFEGGNIDLDGVFQIDRTGGNANGLIINGATGSNNNLLFSKSGSPRWYIGPDYAGGGEIDELRFRNSSFTTQFTIQQGGNVGINEVSPSAKLHVKGAGATSGTTSFLVENSAGTDSFNVLGDGDIGIGTAAPSARLDIVGDGTNYALEVNNTSTGDGIKISTANSTSNDGILWLQGANALFNVYSTAGNAVNLVLNNGVTSTVHLNSSGDSYINGGDLAIGSTSATEKLTLTGRAFLANITAPATPTGGGTIYVESGALKYIGSSGTITTLGAA